MAKINYYVRSKQNGQPATVYLRYTIRRETDLWVPITDKVFPEHWSSKTGTFKQKIIYTNVFTEETRVAIERRFAELKQYINEEELKHKGPITKEWLKSIIDKYYNRTVGDENLNGFIQRFIDETSSGKRLIKGKRYIFSTIKNYKTFQVQINEYQGIYTEKGLKEVHAKNKQPRPYKALNFEDITIDFYKDFVRYFNEKNYSPNTIGRHVKHLKVIMRHAKDEGLHNNIEFQHRSFESMQVPVENVYLNERELKAMFDLDLSDKKHLEIARDVFLCGCYTAQRYSDYCRISKSSIKEYSGAKVIELIQQKTGEKCIIPIRPELNHILAKYDYTLPKTHEQKVNKYIKDVAGIAEITDEIYYEENRGGMVLKKSTSKNELIKTHTARRSGCTNMYLAKIPVIDIMKISAHKTEREFLKYIKVTKEETAVNLASHPYFIGNTLSIAK